MELKKMLNNSTGIAKSASFKKILIVFGLMTIITVSSYFIFFNKDTSDDPPDDPPNFNTTPFTSLDRGINLGNALDAPREGLWGSTIRESDFNFINESGFDFVRLPVRWSNKADDIAPFTIDATFMERVHEVINWSLSRDLTIIIDNHYYDDFMNDPAGQENRFLAIWDQIAKNFSEYPDKLLFEIMNEPMGDIFNNLTTNGHELWNSYALKAINTIRATNPTKNLIVGGIWWNHVDYLQYVELPENDTNIIATFHYYEPFNFTHQDADWVEGSSAWSGLNFTGNATEMARLEADFDKAQTWAESNNRSILVGEFGANLEADKDSILTYARIVREEAEKRGFGWAYWDLFTDSFGFYFPNALQYGEDYLDALIPQTT